MAHSIENPVDGARGQALWDRADKALPGGGIYLSRSADFAGRGVLPGFIAAAEGCRITDADGRRYIDFLGSNGPNILGYRHPEVEAAVRRQADVLTSASLFPPSLVEVVERILAKFTGFSWGLVSKNGSEVVSLGARVARQHTGRRGLITFARAYHGSEPELATSPQPGPLTELTSDVARVAWNDPQALIDLVKAHNSKFAAILLNPLDQNPRLPTAQASTDFVAAIEQVREQHGVLVVFDDVRHGFRLHPDGSHRLLGLEPDLSALGKALGNGHAISALVGRETVRRAARKIFYTSTYMFEAPPMAAAMAVLDIYDRDEVFSHITRMGERLRAGIALAASAQGHRISQTGPVTMPTLLFDGDQDGTRQRIFAREAAGRGAIFHPGLNWNLSAAHRATDIDEAIEIAAAAFAATPIT